ncbi:MAG: hypothetical protein ACK5V3_14890, partial [Bdellovibrionales bacterium]
MPHVNPSAIDWRENEGGALVAFEDSKALDTENDIYFNGLQFSEGPLVIIGIGSGFIIDKILKTNPNSKIIAIECRDGLMARQRKKYPNVEFHLLQSWQDFENCPEVEYWMRPEVQKILNRPALGQQSQFFQELFYYLNLRTRKSIEKIVKLHSSIDDRWLVN